MKIGTKISGRYQILELIGSGGMAKVYLARDLILDRDVAVKMLRLDFRDDEAIMRRFQREALAATELVHPNVVSIYDVGEENGLQYIVMEYVNGTDLKEYIKNNYPISFDQIVRMMEQILSAISLAHKKQIIHRDLKPQNILVDSAGNCKITDFGIALALTETSVTQTNTLLGSVHYLSPEQARGSIATKQSDLYALGIILYEMITGDVPFDGESAVSIALKHFQEEIPSIKEYYSNVPQALENVVLKATAKDPKDRYATADEMAEDLETVLAANRQNEAKWEPGQTTNTTNEQVDDYDFLDDELEPRNEQDLYDDAPRPKKNHKKGKLALILVVILLLIGGCTALFYSGGKNIDVPNVEGKTIDEATKVLEAQGFKVSKNYKYQYNDKIGKDLVIATNPADNAAAEKGSTIKLYVSKGTKQVELKDYTGQNYQDVVKELRKAGIKRNQIEKETRLSSGYAKGQIISQEPTSGTLRKGEGKVKFIVSEGVSGKVKDLKDMSLEEVQQYADNNQLTLVTQYEYVTKGEDNKALSQDPEAGTVVQVGDTIFVTFSKLTQAKSTPSYQNYNQQNQNKDYGQNQTPSNQNNANKQQQNNKANNQQATPNNNQQQNNQMGNAGVGAGNQEAANNNQEENNNEAGSVGNANGNANAGAGAGADANNEVVAGGEQAAADNQGAY